MYRKIHLMDEYGEFELRTEETLVKLRQDHWGQPYLRLWIWDLTAGIEQALTEEQIKEMKRLPGVSSIPYERRLRNDSRYHIPIFAPYWFQFDETCELLIKLLIKQFASSKAHKEIL